MVVKESENKTETTAIPRNKEPRTGNNTETKANV